MLQIGREYKNNDQIIFDVILFNWNLQIKILIIFKSSGKSKYYKVFEKESDGDFLKYFVGNK